MVWSQLVNMVSDNVTFVSRSVSFCLFIPQKIIFKGNIFDILCFFSNFVAIINALAERMNTKKMNSVTVRKVSTKKDLDAFVQFPLDLYKGCKQYIPDLNDDVRNSFNPKKNHGLSFTEVQAFIAERDGVTVGRIAGIINTRANTKWNIKCVRFSYIDFIDDMEVSAALLQTVAEWGKERGMDVMQGPLGITDFDKEGMLIEDFDREGSMIEIYNYAYYPKHMKAHGFDKVVDWVQIRVKVPETVPARYARVARLSKEMYNLTVKKISHRDGMGKGGHRLFDLMNQSFAPLFGYSEFSPRQVDFFLKNYVPHCDMDLIPLIENDKGELVGAAVTMGSLNKALRKAQGKLLPWGWVHLLKSLYFKNEDTANLMLVAVRPDMQGLGVNALIFDDLIPIYNKKGYKYAETGPQLEDNVKELSQWKPLNPETIKRRRCFGKSI